MVSSAITRQAIVRLTLKEIGGPSSHSRMDICLQRKQALAGWNCGLEAMRLQRTFEALMW